MRPSADVQRAVERFGQSLELQGIPRMSARVLAFVMIGDQESYSARDLAEGLDVSPAAISGAMRYLVESRLLLKERAPRTRGDLFRLAEGDVWAGIFRSRIPLLEQINANIDDAIALLEAAPAGEASAGLERMRETREFFDFVRRDMPEMLERWETHQATR